MTINMKLLIVLAVTLIGTKVSMATDLVCTTGEADIIFVLDGSASIFSTDFALQQQFAADVSAAFNVGPADTRFGAIIFSTSPTELFALDTYSTNEEISKALLAAPQPMLYTNTDLALNLAQSMMSKARPGATKVVIVITDGQSGDAYLTAQAAVDLKSSDVTTLAVGVEGALHTELLAIASQPDYVFEVDTYQVIQTLKDDVIGNTCEAIDGNPIDGNPHPPCPNGQVVGSQCLTFISQKMTQADAAQSCAANGATIFEARTEEQYNQLGDIANANGVKLWAGAEEAAEGDWRWLSDNAEANIPIEWFARSQSNNCGGNKTCLQMQQNRKFNNAACGKSFAFICVN